MRDMSEEITLTYSGDFQSTESQEFQTRSRRRFYPSQVVSLLLVIVAIFFLAIVALGATLAVEKQKLRTDPTSCLDDWIGYQQNCFHFSENTTTWGKSQSFCASHKATLAVFNITKELSTVKELNDILRRQSVSCVSCKYPLLKDFLKRYAGHSQYWIGLSREQGAEWQWADGTMYNSGLKITGNGQYAYLHKNGISSSSSHLLKKWICSKRVAYTPRN